MHASINTRKTVKSLISALDNCSKTNLYGNAVKLEEAYYSSDFLNAVRRNVDPYYFREYTIFEFNQYLKNILEVFKLKKEYHLNG